MMVKSISQVAFIIGFIKSGLSINQLEYISLHLFWNNSNLDLSIDNPQAAECPPPPLIKSSLFVKHSIIGNSPIVLPEPDNVFSPCTTKHGFWYFSVIFEAIIPPIPAISASTSTIKHLFSSFIVKLLVICFC